MTSPGIRGLFSCLNVVAEFVHRRKWSAPAPLNFTLRAVSPAEIDACQPELRRRLSSGSAVAATFSHLSWHYSSSLAAILRFFRAITSTLSATHLIYYRRGLRWVAYVGVTE